MRAEIPWEGDGIPEEQEFHTPAEEPPFEYQTERERAFRGKAAADAPRRHMRLLYLIAGAAAAASIAAGVPAPQPQRPEPIPIAQTLPPETEPTAAPETEPPTIIPETEPPTIIPETEPPTTIPETVPADAEILVRVGTWQGSGICVHFSPGGSGWWDGDGRYGVLSWTEDETGAVHYSGWGSWTVVEETESGDSGDFYPVSKLKKGSCSGIAVLTSGQSGYLLSMDNPIDIDCTAYSGGQTVPVPEAVKVLDGLAPIEYMQSRSWAFAPQQDGITDWLYTDIRPASLTFGEEGCTVTCQVYYDDALAHEFSFVAAVEYPEGQPNAIRLVLPEYPMQFIFTYNGWTVNDGIYQQYLFCSLLLTEDGPRMTVTALNEFISYASEYVLLAPEG